VIATILWLVFIGVLVWILLLFVAAWIGSPKTYTLQKEVDLRLTYKRYLHMYPGTRISYPEYKRLQVERAYRKAVSSTRIKRMVR